MQPSRNCIEFGASPDDQFRLHILHGCLTQVVHCNEADEPQIDMWHRLQRAQGRMGASYGAFAISRDELDAVSSGLSKYVELGLDNTSPIAPTAAMATNLEEELKNPC